MKTEVYPGSPFPLGATCDEGGVNFALYSENATGVALCLFDDVRKDIEPVKIRMRESSHNVWHCYIPDLKPGHLYRYRVYGPYEPHNGHRFNPHKLLIDPYAKAISGTINWDNSLFGYEVGSPQEDLSFSEDDKIGLIDN